MVAIKKVNFGLWCASIFLMTILDQTNSAALDNSGLRDLSSSINLNLEERIKRESQTNVNVPFEVKSISRRNIRRLRSVTTLSLSPWVTWTSCSSIICNVSGFQYRNRTCVGGSHHTTCLEPLYQFRLCLPCTVATVPDTTRWANWAPWSRCSASCGQGMQHRDRLCLRTDDKPCTGHIREQRICLLLKTCPTWSTWHSWGACSTLCGTGIRYRSRDCFVRSVYLGIDSTSGTPILKILPTIQLEESREVVDVRLCEAGEERSVQGSVCEKNCSARWTNWQPWSPCSSTCGLGSSYAIRFCLQPEGTRSTCVGEKLDYRKCYAPPCWSSWSRFSSCKGKCKGKFGNRTRTRICTNKTLMIQNYTNCSGASKEQIPCRLTSGNKCQNWGEWSKFSSCSKTCGGGKMTKRRRCYASKCIGRDVEKKSCNLNRCPEWEEWAAFSCCSVTCGETGVRERIRACRRGSPGVPGCEGPTSESEVCSPGPCNATRPHVLETTQCGRRNSLSTGDQTTKKIIGGQQSKAYGWPWHGSLQHYDCDGGSCGWKHLCGAALIAPYWFITAGHCSEDSYYRVNRDNPGDKWRVVFGMNHLHQEGTPYFLSRIFVHPNYSFITVPKADVALVKLRWPVESGPDVMPTCMPGGRDPRPGERCFITGWDALQAPVGQKLLEAKVPVLAYSTCRKLGTNYTILEENHHLCAGDPVKAETDTCHGDSGGPLSCMRSDGSSYLAGVTSFGFRCGEPGHVGIYARMTSYEGWVREKIASVNDCL